MKKTDKPQDLEPGLGGAIGQPVDYGGLVLKNRIVFAPTTMGLGEKAYLQKLEAIAAGGCAMIVIGDVPVSRSRVGFGLFSPGGFARYQRIVRAIHRHDCKVCAQLHQNDTHFGGMFRYLPDMIRGRVTQAELRELLNRETGTYISQLPTEKVREITSSFGPAGGRGRLRHGTGPW